MMTAAEIGAVIDEKVARMRSIADAVADVAMAEGVYQVVKGNYDRAAATTDPFSKGNFPPAPEVVQTPRTGRTLTHRVALHLQGGQDPADPANATPRAKREPALNTWLAGQLPPMGQVFAAVEYVDPATSADRRVTVSMADLGLELRPRPGDLGNLVLHRLVEHGEAGPGRKRQQPLLGGAGDLGERELDFLRQRLLGRLLGRDDLNGV